jgi:DEAD/DEAH box helicase domain-containing protein
LDALSPAQADELAALSSVVEAKCHVADRSPIVTTESSSTRSLIAEAFGAGRAIRWAASDVGALAPRAVWGTGTDQTRFMTESLPGPLKPVPAAWTELEPSQLRRPVAGLSEVRIFNELNGSAADFGKRAWLLVGQRDSALARRLGQAQSVTRITYTDRYLKSPLNILLLHGLLAALVEYQGGIVSGTHITIRTEFLSRVDTREPYLLFHDWRDAQIRLEVIQRLFSDIGIFQFQELAKPSLPHARELLIEWSDGLPWTMRLDQGFGYWKLKRGERGQFPFAQGVDRQLARLRNANIPIEGGGAHYPTYWYCGTEGTI